MSEQEIDLRKARPGCEVTFRCGAKLRIASINYAPGGSDKQRVWFVGFPEDSKDYHPSGRQWFDAVGVNDIVAVSNPPMTAEERLAEIAKTIKGIVDRDCPNLTIGDYLDILALAEGCDP